MKRQANNKYHGTKFQAIPKHRNTFLFHPGNTAEVSVKIPAYNTQGKEYKRILPAIRDKKKIDFQALCDAINVISPGNTATYTGTGININDVEILINNGIATYKKTKLRYNDCYDLVGNLNESKVLICNKYEIIQIKKIYTNKCLKH